MAYWRAGYVQIRQVRTHPKSHEIIFVFFDPLQDLRSSTHEQMDELLAEMKRITEVARKEKKQTAYK